MITQRDFDLERYAGTWHEVAKMRNPWEKDCSYAIAEYSLYDGKMLIKNSCLDKSNKIIRSSNGVARIPDMNDKSKLLVKFDPLDPMASPFEGQYWVFYTDYTKYSFVGDEKRQFFWVLSRNQSIPKKDIMFILGKIKEFGYNPDLVYVNTNLVK